MHGPKGVLLVQLASLKKSIEERRREFVWQEVPLSSEEIAQLSTDSEHRWVEVRVTQYMNPNSFFVNLAENVCKVEALMREMNTFYSEWEQSECRLKKEEVVEGLPVAANYGEFGLHRAVVENILEEQDLVRVAYVDFGTKESLDRNSLMRLHAKFMDLPAQSIAMGFYDDVIPTEGNDCWGPEVQLRFLELTSLCNQRNGCSLFALVLSKNDEGKLLVALTVSPMAAAVQDSDIHVSDVLVREGLMRYAKNELSVLPEEEMSDVGSTASGGDVNQEEWETDFAEELWNSLAVATTGAECGEREVFDGGAAAEFVPKESFINYMTQFLERDSALLMIKILEIKRKRLRDELQFPMDSESVAMKVDQLEDYDRKIQALERLLIEYSQK